jgi:long-chain acyl-CoA synthetase
VKAIIALRPGMQASADELIAFCDQRLADYKRPRSIDFVDELPRSPSGKLLKNIIRKPYWEAAGRNI